VRASSRDKSLVGVEMARDFGLLRFGVTVNNRSQQINIQRAHNGTTVHFVDIASMNLGQFKMIGRASDSSPTAHVHSMAPMTWLNTQQSTTN